jgi:UDP-2,3-diacylglucosamine pyrophosphatase LpxH
MMTDPEKLAEFVKALAEKPTTPNVELVINGDFLDFLAEEVSENKWKAFRDGPGEALAAMENLMKNERDGKVFDQLASFLARGHRLTLLIGNHDIELSFPEVRAAFECRLKKCKEYNTLAFDLHWVINGEAYIVGDALIEHGNRYDPFNFVDYGRLQRLCELRSRRLYHRAKGVFFPPVGSRLVAEVMNPIKKDYSFIDLLKPESKALFALILALDPSQRRHLLTLANQLSRVPLFVPGVASDPDYRQRCRSVIRNRGIKRGKISNSPNLPGSINDSLSDVIKGKCASYTDHAMAALSLIQLLFKRNDDEIESRLRLLQGAIRALNGDQTFDGNIETDQNLHQAAKMLTGEENQLGPKGATSDFRYVIFGHTHHKKEIILDAKKETKYVNTGTWARLMKFPDELLSSDDSLAKKALADFVQSMKDGTFEPGFAPHYARLDLRDDGFVESVELHPYSETVE